MRVYLWGFIVVVLMSAIGRVGAQDVVSTVPAAPPVVATQSLRDVVSKYNICPQDVLAANRSVFPAETAQYIENISPRNVGYAELPIDIVIPPHEPCYTIVQSSLQDLPRVELEYNVCIEDFYDNSLTIKGSDKLQIVTWYLWRQSPPCINSDGQRLHYVDANERRWESVGYNDFPFINAPSDVAELGICLNDIIPSNPHIAFEGYSFGLPYLEGMRLFVPRDAQQCIAFPHQEGQTLLTVSQQTNVCVGVIAKASYLRYGYVSNPTLFVPVDAPPCYDAEGHRLGMKQREIYTTQPTDSFLEVALKYEVCLNDLWDANPVMTDWFNAGPFSNRQLPGEIFIPDTPPCAEPMKYTLPISQTGSQLIALTNVCGNRLSDANPDIPMGGSFIAMGVIITIPERPHCFNFARGVRQVHTCYPIPITAETDLTGHEPPLSWSYDTDLPYCYQLSDGMTVWYENKPYTMYADYGSALVTLQCFDVDDVYIVRMQYGEIGRWSEYGKRFHGDWLMIPQPHADCPLLHMDRKMRQERMNAYRTIGALYNGIYRVDMDETLSTIGRKLGYLPLSIAQANNLSEPYNIYFLQELKMPPYPSLYTLIPVGGAGVVIVLASSAIYGLRRWRRSRYKGKRKNEAA
jgi:hypothetical protein